MRFLRRPNENTWMRRKIHKLYNSCNFIVCYSMNLNRLYIVRSLITTRGMFRTSMTEPDIFLSLGSITLCVFEMLMYFFKLSGQRFVSILLLFFFLQRNFLRRKFVCEKFEMNENVEKIIEKKIEFWISNFRIVYSYKRKCKNLQRNKKKWKKSQITREFHSSRCKKIKMKEKKTARAFVRAE